MGGPPQKKIHQESNFRSDQMESSLFLKACKEGASTTSEGNQFQLSTTLEKKKKAKQKEIIYGQHVVKIGQSLFCLLERYSEYRDMQKS